MKIAFIFFYSLICCNAVAQLQGQAKLDSMMTVLSQEKEDTNKVKTLNRISQYYYYAVPLKSFPYANQALQLAEKLQWKRGIANLHNNLGLFVGDTGNNELAIEHYLISYKLNTELGAKNNQVNNLNNIGRSYQFGGDNSKASEYFFKALKIADELKDNDLIALVATNLTFCFASQENYTKGKEYGEMALKYGTLANNPPRIITSLAQLGGISLSQNDTINAKKYYARALDKANEVNDRLDAADIMGSMSELYPPGNLQQIDLLLRANKIAVELSPSSEVADDNYFKLGRAYFDRANTVPPADKKMLIEKAETYLIKAKTLAERNASQLRIARASLVLSQVKEAKGNDKEALSLFKKATAINDSLFSQEKKNTIAGLEGKRNLAVKDDEIAINKLMLASQRKTQWGLTAGLALLGIIGGLLFWQSRSRKKTNTTLMVLNNQLDEANKVKARFFSILSHDLRSPIVNLVHFLQLQKESPDLLNKDQQAAHQQNISESAEDLLNNMEAMLLWSKEQMENFRPNIKMIAVNDLFEYIKRFFGHTEKVSIIFNAEPGLVVSTDENYLRTIMQNLTSNAIRAVKNTPNANIEWKAIKDGKTTVLSITDNGPGIGAEQAKTLFDERVMNNEKHGLGLHLIRDLAKAIQYKIAVQSEQGRGTTFTLSNATV